MALTKEADPIMTPTGCDVAIIGAGASGLAAAWLLASRGLSVVVLEQVRSNHKLVLTQVVSGQELLYHW